VIVKSIRRFPEGMSQHRQGLSIRGSLLRWLWGDATHEALLFLKRRAAVLGGSPSEIGFFVLSCAQPLQEMSN
jgi:hypothetical protein